MKVIETILGQCLEAARAAGISSGSVAAPFDLGDDSLPGGFNRWNPGDPSPAIFVGDAALVPPRVTAALLASGRTGLFCRDDGAWRRVGIGRLLRRRMRPVLLEWLRRRADDDLLVRALRRRRRRPEMPAATASAQPEWSHFVAVAERQPILPAGGSIVHANVGLGAGGAERQIVDTLLALSTRNLNVAFVGEDIDLPGQRFHAASLTAAGIAIDGPVAAVRDWYDLPPELGAALAVLPAAAAGRIAAMIRIFRRLQATVVHAWQDAAGVRAALAALAAGVPTIVVSGVSIAPDWVEDLGPWVGTALRATAASGRVRFANNSQTGARSYAGYLGIPQSRIAVVPNGVDVDRLDREALGGPEFRRDMALGDDERLVVGILRLAPEKRPLLWIDSAIEAARRCPDMHFVLIGDGPLGPDCKARIAASGLGRRLRNLAPMQGIGAALAAAQGLLLTSAVEGLPNVVLESMVLGTSVIATRVGDLGDIVDLRSGRLLPAEADAGAFAIALEGIPAPLVPRAAYGRVMVRDRFSPAAMIDATCALYGLR